MFKLRDGVELPKMFKIKVNESQSKVLQEHLFANGGVWYDGGTQVKYLDADYLFYGSHLENRLTRDFHDPVWFDSVPLQRVRFRDYFKKLPETVVVPKITSPDTSAIGLRLHQMERTIKLLTAENKSLKEYDRDYYRDRCKALRQKVWELTNKKSCDAPEKWCVIITESNMAMLNTYLRSNIHKYKGINDTWIVDSSCVGLYFLSESHDRDYACDWHPVGYALLTTKQVKKVI